MKVAGIVAEYNPFHKGHLYQIEVLRKEKQPDYVVIAMGGNFLQRGAPAILDKYARTQMALSQGADLVFELPACFATASGSHFSKGGVALLNATGIVDILCFGAECDSLDLLSGLSRVLEQEPSRYKEELAKHLRDGFSFPAARAKALIGYEEVLNQPNNILALEYIKAIRQTKATFLPYLVPRKGSPHHELTISGISSATAIRRQLLSHGDFNMVKDALPKASWELIQEAHCLLDRNNFSLLLHHCLLRETAESLGGYADMSHALANRIHKLKEEFSSWTQFCEKTKTKNTTYARISRILTHILLDLKQESCQKFYALDALPYLRVLGFRKEAMPLMTALKKKASAPIITNPGRDKKLSSLGWEMLGADLYAADLYRSVLTAETGRTFPTEYRRKMLVK